MRNCDATGIEVLRDVLGKFNFPILVIDDGSDIPVTTLMSDPLFKLANSCQRLEVIRHERNRGKGAAIQSAIKHCQKNKYTHLLTMDGDGQHLSSELPKMIEASLKNPNDIVVGARIFEECVPSISRVGRRYSNYWIEYQTGKEVSDSQSGLRIYPIDRIQNIQFKTKKYDFEFEVLVKSIWEGMDIIDVPVKVHYPPEEERISSFHKFWDNALIVLLNIYFITASVFTGYFSAKKIILAIVYGGLISFVPTLPLKALAIWIFSFFLRTNILIILVSSLCFYLLTMWY